MTDKPPRPHTGTFDGDAIRKLASAFAGGIDYPERLRFSPQMQTAMLAARDNVSRHIGIVKIDDDVEVSIRISLDYRTLTLTHPSGKKQTVKIDDMLAIAAELLHARVLDEICLNPSS